MATEKQIAFLRKLLDERIDMYDAAGEVDKVSALREMDMGILVLDLDVKEASASIDRMIAGNKSIKATLAPLVAARKGTAAPAAELTDGMYRLSNGRIFKVQWNREETNLYAKELITETENGETYASFEFVRGAIRLLTPADKMTLEEAKEYGALYGTCCVCARTLTNEASIEAGIGPVCASKF